MEYDRSDLVVAPYSTKEKTEQFAERQDAICVIKCNDEGISSYGAVFEAPSTWRTHDLTNVEWSRVRKQLYDTIHVTDNDLEEIENESGFVDYHVNGRDIRLYNDISSLDGRIIDFDGVTPYCIVDTFKEDAPVFWDQFDVCGVYENESQSVVDAVQSDVDEAPFLAEEDIVRVDETADERRVTVEGPNERLCTVFTAVLNDDDVPRETFLEVLEGAVDAGYSITFSE